MYSHYSLFFTILVAPALGGKRLHLLEEEKISHVNNQFSIFVVTVQDVPSEVARERVEAFSRAGGVVAHLDTSEQPLAHLLTRLAVHTKEKPWKFKSHPANRSTQFTRILTLFPSEFLSGSESDHCFLICKKQSINVPFRFSAC